MEGLPFDKSVCMTNNNMAKMHRCLSNNDNSNNDNYNNNNNNNN